MELVFALGAAAIFVAWCFLIALWFRRPFSPYRVLNISVAAIVFVIISIGLHLLGITGRSIIDLLINFIVGLVSVLDWIGQAIFRLFSATFPVDLSEWARQILRQLTERIVDLVDLVGGAEAGDNFLANMILVLAYLFLRSVIHGAVTLALVGAKTLGGAVSSREDDLDDYLDDDVEKDPFEKEGHSWWFDTPSAKRATLAVYRSSICVLALCVLGGVVAAALTESGSRIVQSMPWTGPVADGISEALRIAMSLYWAGIIVLSGEIAAAVKSSSWFERFLARFAKQKPQEEKNSLRDLFEEYKAEFGGGDWLSPLEFAPDDSHPQHDVSGAGQTGQVSCSEEDAAILLRDFKANSLSRLKAGVLTSSDFKMMATLVQITKDSGGSTLIVCPQSQNQDDRSHINQYDDISSLVRDNLKDAMGHTVFDVTQSLAMLRDKRTTRDLDYSILIGSEFEMADVLSRNQQDSAYQALTRVRSIILIEFQRLDTGVLALQMQRLRRAGQQKRYAVFCQSDACRGLKTTLANLFQDGSPDAFNSDPLQDSRKHHRFWLLWRHHEGLLGKLFAYSGLQKDSDAFRQKESLPLLIVPSWLHDTSVSIYDPFGRILLTDWREHWVAKIQSIASKRLMPALKSLRSISPFGLFRTRELSQIVFQEDHVNILEVIQRYRNFEHTDDTIVHVVSSWYPMREFFYERLSALNPGKKEIQIPEAFLPIQPKPANGPKQVAISVYDAIHHENALTDIEVERIIDQSNEPAPRLLKDMGVTSAKRGVQMLLSRVLGLNADLNPVREPGQRATSYTFDAGTLPQDFYLADVVWKNAETERSVARVYAGDYGLSYTLDSFLPVGRTLFKVDKVDSIKFPIEADTVISVQRAELSETSLSARPAVKFCRNYRLIHEHERMENTEFRDEVKDYPAIIIERGASSYPSEGGVARRLVHMSFERETFGRYMYEHNEPFGRAQTRDCAAVLHPNRPVQGEGFKITRVHQPVLVLSFVGKARGAKRGDRGKIAFTLAATLSDVAASLFPRDAHRLAIVSPQASLAYPRMRGPGPIGAAEGLATEVQAFAELSYPQFISPSESEEPGAPRPDWSRAYGDVFDDGQYRVDDPATDLEEDKTFSSRRIDILAIEDAGLDLGLARAIYENWDAICPHWIEYLSWVSKQTGTANPYAFGSDAVPEQFDFEGALEWLS